MSSDQQKPRGGWSNPASAENGRKSKAGGRPITTAKIHKGDGLMVGQVYPDGGYVDLGRGKVRIEARGLSRIIIIEQSDGSEIRILRP